MMLKSSWILKSDANRAQHKSDKIIYNGGEVPKNNQWGMMSLIIG